MRAVTLTAYGGIENITVQDVPRPVIEGPHDVIVAMKAAALNHLDLWVLGGLPGFTHAFPHTLGCDGTGVVEAVGDAVTRVKPGDAVMLNPGLSCGRCEFCRAGEQSMCQTFGVIGEHATGTFAEAMRVPESNLLPLPQPVDWHHAAAYPLATITGYRMVRSRAAVQPGESVLVWGIGGGVAQAALQAAKLCGARVLVTSSSDEKLSRARELGADGVVNHGREDVVKAARAFAGGRGVNVVVDSVGAETWERSTRALARGGRIVTCGGTTGHDITTDVRKLMWHHWTILGSTMGNDREFTQIVSLFVQGRLRSVVDRVFPMDEARAAFERLRAGRQFGKIVLEIGA